MYYSLLHYPNIDTSKIDAFKSKYDPYYPGVGSHITLVFPVSVTEIDEAELARHIASILKHWKPFDIHMIGLEKSWDHWLFLTLKEGNKEIIKLHDELYTGLLEPFLRNDIEFRPHIAIGLFAQQSSGYRLQDPTQVALDEAKYHRALQEARELNLDYTSQLDKLTLIKVERDLRTVVSSQEFPLMPH